MRQAAFKGLREDKPAQSVEREEAETRGAMAKRDVKAEAAVKNEPQTIAAKRTSSTTAGTDKSLDSSLPIRLTHPDKILDAKSGLTKDDLAHYYLEIAGDLLPYIEGRPLTPGAMRRWHG